MFDASHYVPILLARRGERIALRELPSTIRGGFTPLLEVPQVPMDWDEDELKPLSTYIRTFPNRLHKDWSSNARLFLDVPYLVDPEELIGGQHPVSVLFSDCRELGLNVVPVTAIERSGGYKAAIRGVMEADERGVCLRLSRDELEISTQVVEEMLTILGTTPEHIDLIVDLALVEGSNVPMHAVAMRALLSAPPFTDHPWRTLTVASGAFPQSLSTLPRGLSALPRADWELWNRIRDGLPAGVRVPTFGDYGIQSPVWEEFNPKFMKANGNIRYTTPDEWLIAKGQTVLGKGAVGFTVYNNLCHALVDRPEYKGPDFSPGDQYMYDCCAGGKGPGTPEIWRRQGTSHHLAAVVDQFSS